MRAPLQERRRWSNTPDPARPAIDSSSNLRAVGEDVKKRGWGSSAVTYMSVADGTMRGICRFRKF
jgi:hypothetical protein